MSDNKAKMTSVYISKEPNFHCINNIPTKQSGGPGKTGAKQPIIPTIHNITARMGIMSSNCIRLILKTSFLKYKDVDYNVPKY